METVLVTGGTGYVAGWTIRKLLEKGYSVKATVRSARKGEIVKTMLENKVSTIVIPDFVVTLGAKFSPAMRVLLTMTGLKYHRSGNKARELLGWNPRPAKDTILDAANYLVANDMV